MVFGFSSSINIKILLVSSSFLRRIWFVIFFKRYDCCRHDNRFPGIRAFWGLFLFCHSNFKNYNLRRFKSIIGFSSKSRVTIASAMTTGSRGFGDFGVSFSSVIISSKNYDLRLLKSIVESFRVLSTATSADGITFGSGGGGGGVFFVSCLSVIESVSEDPIVITNIKHSDVWSENNVSKTVPGEELSPPVYACYPRRDTKLSPSRPKPVSILG